MGDFFDIEFSKLNKPKRSIRKKTPNVQIEELNPDLDEGINTVTEDGFTTVTSGYEPIGTKRKGKSHGDKRSADFSIRDASGNFQLEKAEKTRQKLIGQGYIVPKLNHGTAPHLHVETPEGGRKPKSRPADPFDEIFKTTKNEVDPFDEIFQTSKGGPNEPTITQPSTLQDPIDANKVDTEKIKRAIGPGEQPIDAVNRLAKLKNSPGYSEYKKYVDEGGMTEGSPESIEAFNQFAPKLNEIRKAEEEEKFRTQKGYNEYSKFVSDLQKVAPNTPEAKEGSPESIKAFNETQQAKKSTIKQVTSVKAPLGKAPQYDFEKTGQLQIPGEMGRAPITLNYLREDQKGLKKGEYRVTDEFGTKFIFNPELGAIADEDGTEIVKEVEVPLYDKAIGSRKVAERQRAHTIADTLAQDYPDIPKKDIVDFFAESGFTDWSTKEKLPEERFFKDNIQSTKDDPLASLNAPSDTDVHYVTKLDINRLQAFSKKRAETTEIYNQALANASANGQDPYVAEITARKTAGWMSEKAANEELADYQEKYKEIQNSLLTSEHYVSPEDINKYATESLNNLISKYGSIKAVKEEQERFDNLPTSTKIIEAGSALVRAVPQGIGNILKTAGAVEYAINNLFTNIPKKEYEKIEDTLLYQAGDAYTWLGEKLPSDPVARKSWIPKAVDTVAQVLLQAGMTYATGGITAAASFGLSQGAASAIDDGIKSGATPSQQLVLGTVGALAASPDIWLMKGWFKGLTKDESAGLLRGIGSSLYKRLVPEVGEVEARIAVRNGFAGFVERAKKLGTSFVFNVEEEAARLSLMAGRAGALKTGIEKVGKGTGLESIQEWTENDINLVAKKLIHKPEITWGEILQISDEDWEAAKYGALGGAFGGGIEVLTTRMPSKELENAKQELDAAVEQQKISIEKRDKFLEAVGLEIQRRKEIEGRKFQDKKGNIFTLVEDRGDKLQLRNSKGGLEIRNNDPKRLTEIEPELSDSDFQRLSGKETLEDQIPTQAASTVEIDPFDTEFEKITGTDFEIVERGPVVPTTAAGKLKYQRDEARRQAETDPLTGVANRKAMNRALPAAEADPNTSVISFDANNFGQINKKLGETEGDLALKQMATSLEEAAKENGGRVFRKGGDEFIVLAPKEKAEKIRWEAERKFGDRDYGDFVVSVSGSIGNTFEEANANLQYVKDNRKKMIGEPKAATTVEIEPLDPKGIPSTIEVPEGIDPEALKIGVAHIETNPNFPKWFRNSQLKDKNGNPMILYHGAIKFKGNSFDPKQTLDGLIHLGTVGQANDRISHNVKMDRLNMYPAAQSEIIPVLANPQNIVEISDLDTEWGYDSVISELVRLGRLPKSAKDNYSYGPMNKQREYFLSVMDKAGIDGLRYHNEVEGKPGESGKNDSYVIFRPEQIKSVWAKDFDPSNPNLLANAEEDPFDTAHKEIENQEDRIAKLGHSTRQALTTARINPEFFSKMKSSFDADGNLKLSDASGEMIRRTQNHITLETTGIDPKTPILNAAFFRKNDINGFIKFFNNTIAKSKEAGYTDEMLRGLVQLRDNLVKMSETGHGIVYNKQAGISHEKIHQLRYVQSRLEKKISNYYVDFEATFNNTVGIANTAFDNYFRSVYFGNKSFSKLSKEDKTILQEEIFVAIVDGDFNKLGITDEQAAEFVINDLDAYVEKHGEEILDNIQELANEKTKIFTLTQEVRQARAFKEAKQSSESLLGTEKGKQKGSIADDTEITGNVNSSESGSISGSTSGLESQTKASKLPVTISKHTVLESKHLSDEVKNYKTIHQETTALEAEKWLKDVGFHLAYAEVFGDLEPTAQSTARRMAVLEFIDTQVSKYHKSNVGLANEWYSRMLELTANMRPTYTGYGQAISQLARWGNKLNRDSVVPVIQRALAKKDKGGKLSLTEQEELRTKAEELAAIDERIENLDARINGKLKDPGQNALENAANRAKVALNRLKNTFGSLNSANKASEDLDDRVNLLLAAADKIRTLNAEGTAAQWIHRNESKVKDWNKYLKMPASESDKYGPFPQGRLLALKDFVGKQFKEESSNKKIKELSEMDLAKYLENENARANLNDPQVAQAVRQFNSNREASIKQIETHFENERTKILGEWKEYLTRENDVYKKDPFFQQFVWEGITKLRKERPDIPPALDRGALAGVHSRILGFQDNKPFTKLYEEEANKIMQEAKDDTNSVDVVDGSWIKIPQSQAEDPDYDRNVNMMRTLSHSNWCTSRGMEREYIKRGDFWVLTKSGKAAMAIRFDSDSIAEIQGPDNNGTIPSEYLTDVKKLVKQGKFQLSSYTIDQLIRAIEKSYTDQGIPIPEFKYVPKSKKKEEKTQKLDTLLEEDTNAISPEDQKLLDTPVRDAFNELVKRRDNLLEESRVKNRDITEIAGVIADWLDYGVYEKIKDKIDPGQDFTEQWEAIKEKEYYKTVNDLRRYEIEGDGDGPGWHPGSLLKSANDADILQALHLAEDYVKTFLYHELHEEFAKKQKLGKLLEPESPNREERLKKLREIERSLSQDEDLIYNEAKMSTMSEIIFQHPLLDTVARKVTSSETLYEFTPQDEKDLYKASQDSLDNLKEVLKEQDKDKTDYYDIHQLIKAFENTEGYQANIRKALVEDVKFTLLDIWEERDKKAQQLDGLLTEEAPNYKDVAKDIKERISRLPESIRFKVETLFEPVSYPMKELNEREFKSSEEFEEFVKEHEKQYREIVEDTIYGDSGYVDDWRDTAKGMYGGRGINPQFVEDFEKNKDEIVDIVYQDIINMNREFLQKQEEKKQRLDNLLEEDTDLATQEKKVQETEDKIFEKVKDKPNYSWFIRLTFDPSVAKQQAKDGEGDIADDYIFLEEIRREAEELEEGDPIGFNNAVDSLTIENVDQFLKEWGNDIDKAVKVLASKLLGGTRFAKSEYDEYIKLAQELAKNTYRKIAVNIEKKNQRLEQLLDDGKSLTPEFGDLSPKQIKNLKEMFSWADNEVFEDDQHELIRRLVLFYEQEIGEQPAMLAGDETPVRVSIENYVSEFMKNGASPNLDLTEKETKEIQTALEKEIFAIRDSKRQKLDQLLEDPKSKEYTVSRGMLIDKDLFEFIEEKLEGADYLADATDKQIEDAKERVLSFSNAYVIESADDYEDDYEEDVDYDLDKLIKEFENRVRNLDVKEYIDKQNQRLAQLLEEPLTEEEKDLYRTISEYLEENMPETKGIPIDTEKSLEDNYQEFVPMLTDEISEAIEVSLAIAHDDGIPFENSNITKVKEVLLEKWGREFVEKQLSQRQRLDNLLDQPMAEEVHETPMMAKGRILAGKSERVKMAFEDLNASYGHGENADSILYELRETEGVTVTLENIRAIVYRDLQYSETFNRIITKEEKKEAVDAYARYLFEYELPNYLEGLEKQKQRLDSLLEEPEVVVPTTDSILARAKEKLSADDYGYFENILLHQFPEDDLFDTVLSQQEIYDEDLGTNGYAKLAKAIEELTLENSQKFIDKYYKLVLDSISSFTSYGEMSKNGIKYYESKKFATEIILREIHAIEAKKQRLAQLLEDEPEESVEKIRDKLVTEFKASKDGKRDSAIELSQLLSSEIRNYSDIWHNEVLPNFLKLEFPEITKEVKKQIEKAIDNRLEVMNTEVNDLIESPKYSERDDPDRAFEEEYVDRYTTEENIDKFKEVKELVTLSMKLELMDEWYRADKKKQKLDQLLEDDPPNLLMAAEDKSIDEFDPDTRRAILDIAKYKYLEGKESGGFTLEQWESAVKNTLASEGVDPTKLDGYYKSLYRSMHKDIANDKLQKEIKRIKEKYGLKTDQEARTKLIEEKAEKAAKIKIEAANKKATKPDKDKRTAQQIAIDNNLKEGQNELTREDVLLAKDKNAFFDKFANLGLSAQEINSKYLEAVQIFINASTDIKEGRENIKAQKVLGKPNISGGYTPDEIKEMEAEKRKEQIEKNRKSKEFAQSIDHILGRPTTNLDKAADWYKRINRSGEALLTATLKTAMHNLIAQRATKGLNAIETVVELGFIKAQKKLGIDIFSEDQLGIPETTKFKNVISGELSGSSFRNTREALDAFFNQQAGLMASLQTLVLYRQQVVEGLMVHNPDLYDGMLGRFSYGSDALHSWPVDPQMGRKGKAVEKTVRGLEKWVHAATSLNRLQEMHFRFATFMGVLGADLKGQGYDLETLISDKNSKLIPRDLLERAVNRSLEDTFGMDIPHDTWWGQKLNALSDVTSWIPFPVNLLLYRRFFYNANRFMIQHSPLILAKIATGKFTARDAAKFTTGLFSYAVALGILQAFGSDDDDPTLLNVFGFNIRVSAYNPLSTYLVIANVMKRKLAGKDMFKASGDALLIFGINSRFPNPGVEWFKSLYHLMGPDDSKYVKFEEQTKILGGRGLAAFIRPLATIKDITAAFYEQEAIERDYAGEPFVGELKKVIPLFGINNPAKEDVLTGQPLKKEYTILDQLGITYVPDRQVGAKFSPAEEYLDNQLKIERSKYAQPNKTPEQKRESAIVAQLFTYIDKGYDVQDHIDRYLEEGKITKGQKIKLEAANKIKSTLERKADGASIKQIVNAFIYATPIEQTILRNVLEDKAIEQEKKKSLTDDELRLVRTVITDY